MDGLVLSIIENIIWIISILGMWNIFLKFGKKGWLALIPVVNMYKLGECTEREKDGFILAIMQIITEALRFVMSFIPLDSDVNMVFAIAMLILALPEFVFSVRIYLGLCKAFGRRKRWVILWSFTFTKWICFLFFGFGRKFHPLEKYVHSGADEDGSISDIKLDGNGRDLSINIKKRTVTDFFKKHTLLRDIHLTVPTGHMVLLLGGSGAGKTTFLNAVTGYEKADADIELGKWNVYRDYNKMKYDIGFVPQQDLMRGSDTVYRTVADAASLRLTTEMTHAEKKQRVEEVLEIFGLGALNDSLVSKLSGGQRKRLSIAIEYISYPKLFILDEPDSGLDGVVARNLFLKLREIADTGKIVIVITHTPDRVIDLFDDIIVLAKDHARTGRLAYYGPVDKAYEFFDKKTIEDILLSINQKDEGGEGRAEEYVGKYTAFMKTMGGEA